MSLFQNHETSWAKFTFAYWYVCWGQKWVFCIIFSLCVFTHNRSIFNFCAYFRRICWFAQKKRKKKKGVGSKILLIWKNNFFFHRKKSCKFSFCHKNLFFTNIFFVKQIYIFFTKNFLFSHKFFLTKNFDQASARSFVCNLIQNLIWNFSP